MGFIDAVADRVAALNERGYNWRATIGRIDPNAICASVGEPSQSLGDFLEMG